MARTVAELPTGTRLTDYISLGVVAKTFPVDVIHRVLVETGTASVRQRELPAHVVIYYVIALALYMQVSYREVLRCLVEGLAWVLGDGAVVRITGKSGISQARTRLGAAPVRQLYETIVAPLAVAATTGALVSPVAAGHRGWHYAGRGRYGRQRRGVRPARGESRRERVSAAPRGGAGGERDACPVRGRG